MSLVLAVSLISVAHADVPPAISWDDRQLVDVDGRPFSDDENNGEDCAVRVIVFLGVDCPLSKLYIARLNALSTRYPSCRVIGVFANPHDTLEEIRAFADLHRIAFAICRDSTQRLADRLGATRITECFVLDELHRVKYSGRIDDQYLVGIQRQRASTHDLRDAIDNVLEGRAIGQVSTKPVGCLISRPDSSINQPDRTSVEKISFTYARDIGPLLDRNCRSCHRTGQSAPFALESYDDARDWAHTMLEQIEQNRMPPWHANPEHGRFSNDSSLTPDEKGMFAKWVDEGMPAGDLTQRAAPPQFGNDWQIGEPDVLLSIPKPFVVPAEGIIEYQFSVVDPGFQKDIWVTAAEIRSSNPAVVHHCNVFLLPPHSDQIVARGALGSVCLVASAVGTPPTTYPPGTAKLIPKGWRLQFVMHYVAVGSEQVDVTQLGLKTIAVERVQREVATRLLLDENLRIPPRVSDHTVTHEWPVPEDLLLLSMFPHMHLRGKSFTYELVHKSGDVEVLLDVPRYDFNWQNRYVLAKPKQLSKGSVLRCRAVYDNSQSNPFNPDPSVTVRTGPQVTDEMFNGYFDVIFADKRPQQSNVFLWSIALVLAGFVFRRKRRRA